MEKKPQSLGIVVFYKMESNHTMTEIGRTPVLNAFEALNIYANTPNPESQLLQAGSINELNDMYKELCINVKNPLFVEENVIPYV